MRAKRILRMPGAIRTGALSLAVAAVAVALGTAAAGALAAPRHPARAAARSAMHRRPHALVGDAAHTRLLVSPVRRVRPSGSVVVIHGFLRPGHRGARVKLLHRSDHRWHTLATARTLRNGRFGLRYRVRGMGTTEIRVAFPGSHRARPAAAPAGKIVALAPTVASWYYDAGNTACGFHATYGVANKTLPCGTKVTLSYGGRTVVATVDDRGPYVYGRTFDLNQNTARYLGMWGVAQVYASV